MISLSLPSRGNFTPTTTRTISPALIEGSLYVQCADDCGSNGIARTAGSQFDPKNRTSYAVPSPSLITAISACTCPCDDFIPGPLTRRASVRSITRGRSNQRIPRVTAADTNAASGITCQISSIPAIYRPRSKQGVTA